MCHSRFYYGPGVSAHGFPSPHGSPEENTREEIPAHFHKLKNGSIWKFRGELGRFCKPYKQRVKVCVICGEIWEIGIVGVRA